MTQEEKQKLFDAIKDNGYKWNAETKTLEKLIVPKFKVGDRIKHKSQRCSICTVKELRDNQYILEEIWSTIPFTEQDHYELVELVPNKFDISTLKPFDKVLYRQNDNDTWSAGFYNFCKNNHHFIIGNVITHQCIPYNDDTKHLLGTTNDCDNFYKTW